MWPRLQALWHACEGDKVQAAVLPELQWACLNLQRWRVALRSGLAADVESKVLAACKMHFSQLTQMSDKDLELLDACATSFPDNEELAQTMSKVRKESDVAKSSEHYQQVASMLQKLDSGSAWWTHAKDLWKNKKYISFHFRSFSQVF